MRGIKVQLAIAAVPPCASVACSPVVRAATKAPSGMPSATSAIANLVIGLVVVILLIVLLVRFLAKRSNVQQKGTIQVLAARQLAPNRSIQIVEVGQKRLLVGVGEDVQLIADVTADYDVGSPETGERSPFGQALSSVLADLRRSHPEEE
ncbi:flagellar biosynthetic protein FliO [Alicyclobacillus dauci]|uniref:Flagellar biosynthetic protein FliO n=1 Tax=Alicyclobacillus dauci TaxID=1475485 RepID=A0ABY6YXR5_9BACL|nr:flagellar biosynthetic protein FliO [Alicyclobacillus dauci]WAH35393.1 flagellar biosynthetic protein FliO [Alicyclobacillus dauci]